jgi:hypothetical protein
MRAIARCFSILGLTALLCLAGWAVLAAAAAAQPSVAPPTNLSPPTISGTAQEGQILTEINGSWTNGPTSFSYQWMQCDGSGNNCAPILVDSTGQTYVVTTAEIGSTISVQEIASNAGGSGPAAVSTPTAVVIAAVTPVPLNTALPTISGIAQEGQTLTETNGSWTPNPTSFDYQWLDCNGSGSNCSPVAGQGNSQTYTLASTDVGSTIRAEEIAFNSGSAATADSAFTTSVTPPPPSDTSLPRIFGGGSPEVGQTLIDINGSWTNNPTSFSYQWLDCDGNGANCTSVAANGTGQSYTPTTADLGFTIKVQESASNAGGQGTAVNSSPTGVVTLPPAPVDSTPPAILGIAQQGQTLTEINGSWTNNPTSFSYQWMDCDGAGDVSSCTSLPGATGQTFTISGDLLLGDTLRVQETANNSGGSGTPVLSAQTGVISLNPSTTGLLALPTNPTTNQNVTLIATVTSSFGLTPPAGAVSFDDGATPIPGCSAVSVSTLNQSVAVTCQTTFSAATSPHSLTAIFTPGLGSGVAGSTSPSLGLPVGRAFTTTNLDVSNPAVFTGSRTTYTATVAPTAQGEPVQPTGSVKFLDHGTPIGSCSAQTLRPSQGSMTAQCTVRYPKSGRHTVTAQYRGDGSFNGSTSPSQPVKVQSRPASIAGAITAKTFWTVFFTPTYTRFLAMTVHKPSLGTTIVLMCHGQGCPFARQSVVVTSKSCRSNPRCVTESSQLVNIVARLHGRRLHVGTVLTIELTRPRWIGKAYVIQIRSGKKPSDQIRCLAPGSTRPGVGC